MDKNFKRKVEKVTKNNGDVSLAQLETTIDLMDKIEELKSAIESIPETVIPETLIPEYPSEMVISNLPDIQKVGVKAISEGGLKGGFGGFWSTVYDKAMTPVKTIGGKVLYKIGDKLQVTAPKGFEGKSFAEYLQSVGYLAPQVANEVVNP